MHLIVYISDHTGGERDVPETLKSICADAKRKNPEHGITGVLFYQDGRFMQVIEGEREALESLMEVLGKDSRHTRITRVVDEPVERRGFEDWNMDAFNVREQPVIQRGTVKKLRRLFTAQAEMDSAVFVDLLKEVCADEGLREAI